MSAHETQQKLRWELAAWFIERGFPSRGDNAEPFAQHVATGLHDMFDGFSRGALIILDEVGTTDQPFFRVQTIEGHNQSVFYQKKPSHA